VAQKQLATKTGGLAISLPVFARFETSLAKPFRVEFTTVLRQVFNIFFKIIATPVWPLLENVGLSPKNSEPVL